MFLGEIVKKYRLEHKISMDEFARLSGLSKGYISMLEKNENPRTKKPISPSIDTIKQVSEVTGIDFNEIIEMLDDDLELILNNDDHHFGQHEIPSNKQTSYVAYKELKGAIAAGVPLEMFEVPDSVQVPVDVDRAFPNAYFLVVRGDSMNKIISEGMYVLIDPCEELNNGEIGVIRVNGTEETLKRFYKMGDCIMLQPESTNPEHKIQTYTSEEEIESISILGKLVWAMTPIGMKF